MIAVGYFAYAKLEAISSLTWDLDKTNTPITIRMSDPNDIEMVQLREQYNLEDVVQSPSSDCPARSEPQFWLSIPR